MIGTIAAQEGVLSGSVQSKGCLKGKVRIGGVLVGRLTVPIDTTPYYEVDNDAGGQTVIIGGVI